MLQVIQKKFARFFVRRARFVMSMDRAREIEHRFRGREEYRRLQLADHVVVSYPKGGRTWLRTMISRYYQLVYDLPESAFLNFDNLHRRDARVPRVFFTHDSYVRKFTGNIDSSAIIEWEGKAFSIASIIEFSDFLSISDTKLLLLFS